MDSGREAHEGESSTPLCDRSKDQTRVRSPRQLPTDHDYAARPANIRLINRRVSFLDRYPPCFRSRQKEKKKTTLVVDRSFHIRGAACCAPACYDASPAAAKNRVSAPERSPALFPSRRSLAGAGRREGSAFTIVDLVSRCCGGPALLCLYLGESIAQLLYRSNEQSDAAD